MQRNLKQLVVMASFVAALAASGCATTDLQASFDGNGGSSSSLPDIQQVMAKDSEAGGE